VLLELDPKYQTQVDSLRKIAFKAPSGALVPLESVVSFKETVGPQAIYQGCLIRFRPIMMTTMAALLGAVPIALGYGAGGEARQPLGLVVVGGLLFSQLVTLYLTPVFYTYMAQVQAWLSATSRARRRAYLLPGRSSPPKSDQPPPPAVLHLVLPHAPYALFTWRRFRWHNRT
jgi:multidrug efflux pump subunit AcrB